MRLLVNLSTLGDRPTGLGVYSRHCAAAIAAAFQAEAVAPPSYQGGLEIANRSPQGIALGSGRTAALRRWFWSRSSGRAPGRFVYSPTHHGLAGTLGQVVTVHDLIALRYPDQHPAQHLYFRHVLPRHLSACRAVFTVSEVSRQDLHERLGVPLASIRVVPNGVDRRVFKPAAGNASRGDFLLAVGASYSHKNVDELLMRAALWKSRYTLVIASARGKYRRHLEAVVREQRLDACVRFEDYVSVEELVALYQRCAAFVYPSRWEGFGVPPLEALACGARVIASDIPAHREVLGHAATFVALGDAVSWEAAFAQLERSPSSDQTAAAQVVLDRFTWKRSAQGLAEALTAVEPALSRREPTTEGP